MNPSLFVVLCSFLTFSVIGIAGVHEAQAQDWWNASREPVGLAPDPAVTPEAVIQVYGARAYSWRGYFGIHTWIAVKPAQADSYVIYEVIGWLQRRKRSVLVIYENVPDRCWYGNRPELLLDRRGDGVDALIEKIDQAARTYPYPKNYTLAGPQFEYVYCLDFPGCAGVTAGLAAHRNRQGLLRFSCDFASTQRQRFADFRSGIGRVTVQRSGRF